MKQRQDNLFAVLERGDRIIERSHGSAIVIAGLTRSGSSTIFNWMLGKKLMGEDPYIQYQNAGHASQLGNQMASATLCPSVADLDKINKISLINMPGFKVGRDQNDAKDYVAAISNPYFYQSLFEKVKKVKFLIVVTEESLIQKSKESFISTFMEFLNMFNLQEFTPQIKHEFYSSIFICVTRSIQGDQYRNYFQEIFEQIQDSKLILQKKYLLINFLEYIINNNSIIEFQAAEADNQALKCQIITKLNDIKWNFFSIPDAETRRKVFNLPLIKNNQMIKPKEQQLVYEIIDQRVRSFIEFSEIIYALIRTNDQNWKNSIEKWRNENIFELDLKNYDGVFEAVKQFLDKIDFYDKQQLPQASLQKTNNMNLIKNMKIILQIYSITDQIGDLQQNFLNSVIAYSNLLQKMIKQINHFSRSKEQEGLLQRLNLVMRRCLREFSKISGINQLYVCAVMYKLRNYFYFAFQQTRKQYIYKFIMQFDHKLMLQIFPTSNELTEYQQFFAGYENKYRNQFREYSFFSQHKKDIQIAKAITFARKKQDNRAIHSYIRAYQQICQHQTFSYDYLIQEIEAKINELNDQKLNILNKIACLLILFEQRDSQEDRKIKNSALNIFISIGNVSQACQLYERIIAQSDNPSFRREKLGQFAEYCLECGLEEKAISLLQKKLFLQKQTSQIKDDTMKMLKMIATQRNQFLERYIQKQHSCSIFPSEENQINKYLKDIKSIIPDQ